MLVEDQAVVVQRSPYSETSYLVTWLSRGHGVLRTLARGAARPRQPLFGKIDLHYSGTLAFARRASSHLHRVISFDPEQRHPHVGRHYTHALCAAYFFQVIDLVVEREHPIPELYDLYTRALDWLETHEPAWALVERFERRVFEHLGTHHPRESHEAARRRLLPRPPATFARLKTALDG